MSQLHLTLFPLPSIPSPAFSLWFMCYSLKHSAINVLPVKLQLRVFCPRNPNFDTTSLRIKFKILEKTVQLWLTWLFPPSQTYCHHQGTFLLALHPWTLLLPPTRVFYFYSLLIEHSPSWHISWMSCSYPWSLCPVMLLTTLVISMIAFFITRDYHAS